MIKKTFKDFLLESLKIEARFAVWDGEDRRNNLAYRLDRRTIKNIGEKEFKKNEDFFSRFHISLEEITEENGSSYRYFAQELHSSLSSEEVWYLINGVLEHNKISFKTLKENKDLIFKNLSIYDQFCGIVDILLWNLDNSYNVGGWREGDLVGVGEEAIIRYSYGYHEKTYGKIFVRRYWGSIESFFEDVKKYLIDNIVKDFVNDSTFHSGEVMREIKKETLAIDVGDKVRIYTEDIFYIVLPYLKRHNIPTSLYNRDTFSETDYETNKTYDKFKDVFSDWIYKKYGNGIVIDSEEERFIEIIIE